jgi:uncharacterized OB-fold protein
MVMETIKVGDCVIITNFETNGEWSPHYKGEISVIDRIDYPFYYLENDNTTPFTKEQFRVIRVISTKNKFNMIKCKKCGSANVKVDFGKICTSIPAKYEYKCQDCGEVSYVDCSSVDMNYFTSEGFQTYPMPDINIPNGIPNVEDKKEPKVEHKGGLMGWICPKCGRCYSPFTSMCSYCCNNMNIITCYDGTFETNLDGTVKY